MLRGALDQAADVLVVEEVTPQALRAQRSALIDDTFPNRALVATLDP